MKETSFGRNSLAPQILLPCRFRLTNILSSLHLLNGGCIYSQWKIKQFRSLLEIDPRLKEPNCVFHPKSLLTAPLPWGSVLKHLAHLFDEEARYLSTSVGDHLVLFNKQAKESLLLHFSWSRPAIEIFACCRQTPGSLRDVTVMQIPGCTPYQEPQIPLVPNSQDQLDLENAHITRVVNAIAHFVFLQFGVGGFAQSKV